MWLSEEPADTTMIEEKVTRDFFQNEDNIEYADEYSMISNDILGI